MSCRTSSWYSSCVDTGKFASDNKRTKGFLSRKKHITTNRKNSNKSTSKRGFYSVCVCVCLSFTAIKLTIIPPIPAVFACYCTNLSASSKYSQKLRPFVSSLNVVQKGGNKRERERERDCVYKSAVKLKLCKPECVCV